MCFTTMHVVAIPVRNDTTPTWAVCIRRYMPIVTYMCERCVSLLQASALTLQAGVPALSPIGLKSNGPMREAKHKKYCIHTITRITMIHRKTYCKQKYGGKYDTTTTESLHIQETDRMTNKRTRMLNWSVTNKHSPRQKH